MKVKAGKTKTEPGEIGGKDDKGERENRTGVVITLQRRT